MSPSVAVMSEYRCSEMNAQGKECDHAIGGAVVGDVDKDKVSGEFTTNERGENEIVPIIEPGVSHEKMLVTNDEEDEISSSTVSDGTADCDDRRRRHVRRQHSISEIEAQTLTANNTSDRNVDQCDVDVPPVSLYDGLSRLTVSKEFKDTSDGDRDYDDVEKSQSVENSSWKDKAKHVFILSGAGKPIYSRYGSEDKLVTTMGVMQALVSCVHDNNQDTIKCIVAGEHRFVFVVHGPIVLVAVSKSHESTGQLVVQLNYLFYQIISVLTATQLYKIFEKRQNYDLRRLLSGCEKFLDNLLCLMETEPSFLLGAVKCLPLAPTIRDMISQTIVQYCVKIKNLVFAIILADKQLVTLVRMKKYFLHTVDLHLIINLVNASDSFKSAESWTPICLPKFDSSGFLHGHISYLEEGTDACLLLLTVDRDIFFPLSECKKLITEKLQKHGCIEAIQQSVLTGSYTVAEVNIPDLRHFLYKVRNTAQYTSPEWQAPYQNLEHREQHYGLYVRLHQRVHNSSRPLKIVFYSSDNDSIFGWVTQGFELYVTFEPLVTKSGAICAINRLLRWIKATEDRLFIMNSPTF